MGKRLFLSSNSYDHDRGYLGHCGEEVAVFFSGVSSVLFVPYAGFDRDAYAETTRKRFKDFDIAIESLHTSADPVRAVHEARGIFVGGGNTFRLLRELQMRSLIEPLRKRVLEGMPYLGTSAGTVIACPTMRTTNDMPIVEPKTLDALGSIDFQINAHYVDANPMSRHMGETREERIREFHEENETPVVGLYEGSWLEVVDERVTLVGEKGARLFRKGKEPTMLKTENRIDTMIAER